MALDIPAVQAALRADGLDGWLLYDFHGSNAIARHIAELDTRALLTTRRWYFLIPAHGEPQGLVHRIEPHSLDHLPGSRTMYADRHELAAGLEFIVRTCGTVAMEYSPQGAIPYVSRVDAGTVEAVRALGVTVVSSGDLVQRFEAVWDDEALATHQQASERLHRIKDQAFALVRDRTLAGTPTTEYDIQQSMVDWFDAEGLVTDCPPVVAVRESAANPHYLPAAEDCRDIRRDDLVLLDLWGKLATDGAVFADITWMGYAGERVPDEYARAFEVIRAARDAAVSLVTDAAAGNADLRGWEVDRAAREIIEQAGYGRYFIHRTGHSLGESVHGNGVHMDDYETHDDRRLLPGTGFTVEPGLYFETFGVRTEINMSLSRRAATVTGPLQTEILPLLRS